MRGEMPRHNHSDSVPILLLLDGRNAYVMSLFYTQGSINIVEDSFQCVATFFVRHNRIAKP